MQIRPRFLDRIFRRLTVRGVSFLTVASPLAAMAGWLSTHQYLVTVGIGHLASMILILVWAVGAAAGVAAGRRSNRFAESICLLAAVSWALGRELLQATVERSLLGLLPDTVVEWCYPFIMGLVLVGPIAVLWGVLLGIAVSSRRSPASALIGSGVGLWVGVSVLSHWMTLQWIGLSCWAIAASAAARFWWIEFRGAKSTVQEALTGTVGSVADQHPPETNRFATGQSVPGWLNCFLSGLALAAGWVLIRQLFPVSLYLMFSAVAGILVGLGIGRFGAVRLSVQSRRVSVCLAVLFVMAFAACFSQVILWQLSANAHVSHAGLMLLLRSLFTMLVVAVPAMVWGLVSLPAGQESRRVVAAADALGVVPALCGFLVGKVLLNWNVEPPVVLSLFGVGSMILNLDWARLANRRSWSWSTAVWPATLLIMVTGAAIWSQMVYQPQLAARLLFSTGVFEARFDGEPLSSLPFLDEGRLVESVAGDHGALTVWKYRGTQLQFREGGIPKAVVSTDPLTCPEYSAELLPALLSLALHQDPAHVMVVGAGGGVALKTALTFPIRSLRCIESDPAVVQMLRNHVWSAEALSPEDDGRMTLIQRNPLIEIRRGTADTDVLIVCPDDPVLAQSAGWWTRGFYEACAARLQQSGLFCQRFRQLDFGCEPMQVVLATIDEVFAETIAFETAPGELIVIATPGVGGTLRAGIVERLQRPHTRQLLAHLGWDWARVLQLPLYTPDAVASMAEPVRSLINTSGNGVLGYRLPTEMMRWGQKSLERERFLSAHRSSMVDLLPPDHRELTEIRYRLNELRSLNHLMADYPDEPWVYRRKLRDLLQSKPRSAIQQVRATDDESSRHPIDQRRVLYFKALSRASRDRSRASIQNLAAFAFPPDPMLSHFVHFEVAELYARSSERDVQAELIHRLHGIYFAHPADRSVRDVVGAVLLLVEHPECEPDRVQQWDHLNALLQTLSNRWNLRQSTPPDSVEIAINDIDKSVEAIRLATDRMTELCAELEFSAADWEARELYLERNLVRPLRSYRSRLLPHLQKQIHSRRKAAASESESDSDGD